MSSLIVIEGMDNSGKSTLARAIADTLGFPIFESEGPPRGEESMNERVRRYRQRDMDHRGQCIYVRHPVVSNHVYSILRQSTYLNTVDPVLIEDFYQRKPLLIYAHALNRGLEGHVEKDHDTPDHLLAMESSYPSLLRRYEQWALNRADVVYRIGDDKQLVTEFVVAKLRYGGRKDSLKRTHSRLSRS